MMLGWLYHRMIGRLERRYGYDATYLHELTDAAPSAFRRFGRMQMAGKWQGPLPRNAWHAASIAGALHEDCGPCVQIATDMALAAGVAPESIADLLSGDTADAEMKVAFDYSRALLSADPALDGLRHAAKEQWGEVGVIALSMTAMTARNYPVLKRAMGHAKACQRVRVGGDQIVVAEALKTA
jgi:hypothetical protein